MVRRELKVALVLVLVLVVAVGGLLGWVIGRDFPQREGMEAWPAFRPR